MLLPALFGPRPSTTDRVLAHGETVESDPAPGAVLRRPPEEVRVTMSAPLAEGSFVQVLAPDFSRVDEGGTRIEPADPRAMRVRLRPLEPGGYTVQWTAVDAMDGHRTHGSFAFDLLPGGPLAGVSPPLRMSGAVLLLAFLVFVIGRRRRGARPLLLLVASLSLVLGQAACQAGGSETEGPRRTSVPGSEASGSVDAGGDSDAASDADSEPASGPEAEDAGRGLQVSIAASDLAQGEERFAFALLDRNGRLVPDAALSVTFFRLDAGEADAASRSEATYYPARLAEAGLYVVHTRFDRAGVWGAQIEGSLSGGEVVRPQRIRFTVAQRSAAPQVGEIPPPTRNRTLPEDPDLLGTITSDPEPLPELYRLTVDEARLNGKPTVVVFATPGFCQSAICGPVLAETKALHSTWGAAVNFIHIEVYADAASQELVPEMAAWGLATEPWVFVLGRDGRVAARLEGSATEAEMEPILRRLVR